MVLNQVVPINLLSQVKYQLVTFHTINPILLLFMILV